MSADPDDFCHQCYGRGWVTIERKRVRCTCQWRFPERGPFPEPEGHNANHGNGTLSHVVATNGSTASVSQEALGWPASFARARLDQGATT